MMSLEIQAAVSTLQQQTDVKKASRDSFELDRTERALDELVRNHTKTTAPTRLVRSARANALKVVKSRAEHGEFSLDAPDLHAVKRAKAERAASYDPMAEFEVLDWLESTRSVTPSQRDLLKALALGYDAEFLACCMGLQVKRVRERISRARKAAYAGYLAEVMCA
jgi:hypothetical protein